MKFKEIKNKFARLFSLYPPYSWARPGFFGNVPCNQLLGSISNSRLICIEDNPNKLYFLLFGLICQELKRHSNLNIQLISVGSVNLAIGSGWLASIKRSSVLVWWWSRQWQRCYGSVVDGIAFRCSALFQPIDNLMSWKESKTYWMKFKSTNEKLNLVINTIEYSDLIIDSYLRFRPSAFFDVNDPFVRLLIWQVLRDIRQAERYFSKAKPKLYLASSTVYIEHGVVIRVALRQGIPVLTFGDLVRFGKRLSLQDVNYTNNCRHYREEFETLDYQADRLTEAENMLNFRLKGGIDPATSYMRKSAYVNNDSLENLQDLNGVMVVFLHDFYDSPHIYSGLIFCDFWHWICFTIDTLLASNVKFYIKPHPNQIELSAGVLIKLNNKYPNLNWLPIDVNNVQLAKAGIIFGVTVYGTIAHELAFLGIPSIACSDNPHSSFDFCQTATSSEEYASLLKSAGQLTFDKSMLKQQALQFYYMHNLHGAYEELELRQAFVDLWAACNVAGLQGGEDLNALQNLRDKPGFKMFIDNLMEIIDENDNAISYE
jgi:hypothetical protein